MSNGFREIVAGKALLIIVSACCLVIAGSDIRAAKSKPVAKPRIHDAMFSDQGFQPVKLKIKSGDSVRWTNKSDMELQLAEGMHPVHTDCKYCPQGKKRGAYVRIAEGASYKFRFIGAGTAKFHNHLMPEAVMIIVVNK